MTTDTKPRTQPRVIPAGNLVCDICDYVHPRPDKYGIVIECDDGIRRCKKCRGDDGYHQHQEASA